MSHFGWLTHCTVYCVLSFCWHWLQSVSLWQLSTMMLLLRVLVKRGFTVASQTFITCHQSLHYIGMSSHILHSLGKFAPGRFWINLKPIVYDFHFASVSITTVVILNVPQMWSWNLQLDSKGVPICHLFGISQNLLENGSMVWTWLEIMIIMIIIIVLGLKTPCPSD